MPTVIDGRYRPDVRAHLAGREGELSRKVTLETSSLARVELIDEPNRVFYVFPGAGRLEVVPALSNRLKRRLIAAGAVVVIIVVLVLTLVR